MYSRWFLFLFLSLSSSHTVVKKYASTSLGACGPLNSQLEECERSKGTLDLKKKVKHRRAADAAPFLAYYDCSLISCFTVIYYLNNTMDVQCICINLLITSPSLWASRCIAWSKNYQHFHSFVLGHVAAAFVTSHFFASFRPNKM